MEVMEEFRKQLSENEELFESRIKAIEKDFNYLDSKLEKIKSNVAGLDDKNERLAKKVEQIKPPPKQKILKCDNTNYSKSANYIERNEKEIANLILTSEETNKNIIVLHELGGMGKTTMAQHVSKYLIDYHNFTIKWFQPNEIDLKYNRILRIELKYTNFDNEDMIYLMNNELREYCKENDDTKILLIFDNILNDKEIEKYIIDLPQMVRVLVTTRNARLLNGMENYVHKFQLKPFDRKETLEYFKRNEQITDQWSDNEIEMIVDKLTHGFVTPLKLKLATNFIQNNFNQTVEWINENINDETNEEQFTNLIIKTFDEIKDIQLFLYYSSFLDTSFISYKTIYEILGTKKLYIDILLLNGIVDVIRINDLTGIKVHDIIINSIVNQLSKFEKRKKLLVFNELCKKFSSKCDLNWDMNYFHVEKLINNNLMLSLNDDEDISIDFFELFKRFCIHIHSSTITDQQKLIDYYEKYLELFNIKYKNEFVDKDDQFILYNLGLIYSNLNKHEKSVDCYLKLFDIKRNQMEPPDQFQAKLLHNIGNEYINIFDQNQDCNMLDKSIGYLKKSFEMFKNVYPNEPRQIDISLILNDLAHAYKLMGMYEKSLEYYQESFAMYCTIYENQLDHPDIAITLNNIGSIYIQLNNYDKSRECFKMSLDKLNKFYANQPDHPLITFIKDNIKLVKKVKNSTIICPTMLKTKRNLNNKR